MKKILLTSCLSILVSGFMATSSFAQEAWCIKNNLTNQYLGDGGLRDTCLKGEQWYIVPNAPGTCIQNRHTSQYLSDVRGFYPNCLAGEKWEFINQGDGTYCVKNALNGQYLSDRFPELRPTCLQGEKWRFNVVPE